MSFPEVIQNVTLFSKFDIIIYTFEWLKPFD